MNEWISNKDGDRWMLVNEGGRIVGSAEHYSNLGFWDGEAHYPAPDLRAKFISVDAAKAWVEKQLAPYAASPANDKH